MFRLDYLSCFLTVLATTLVGRKSWTGLLISIVNSLVVCVIGVRTSQFGFIPANLFCVCVYAFSIRSWHRGQRDRNQAPPPIAVRSGTAIGYPSTRVPYEAALNVDLSTEKAVAAEVPFRRNQSQRQYARFADQTRSVLVTTRLGLRQLRRMAPTDSTVPLHGETGTGKKLIASAIHN
jgi:hypothetical protein